MASLPFILAVYVLSAALLASGVRDRAWANAMAGIFVATCLTYALAA